MRRISDLRMMRVEVSAAVNVAGVRATHRHLLQLGQRFPLSTLAKRCKRDDWTVEELAQLAPIFGGRLVMEMPDHPATRADVEDRRRRPFYK